MSALGLATVVLLSSLLFLGPEEELAGNQGGGGGNSQSSSVGGGGDADGGGDMDGGSNDVLFKVLSQQSQTLYLRKDSKGDYTGTGEYGFAGDRKYYLEQASDINPLYYLGHSLKESGRRSAQLKIELVLMKSEILPYASYQRINGSHSRRSKFPRC